jgi:hypothetical protein
MLLPAALAISLFVLVGGKVISRKNTKPVRAQLPVSDLQKFHFGNNHIT